MKKFLSVLLTAVMLFALTAVTLPVYATPSDDVYRWDFNGNLDEANNKVTLTASDSSIAEGYTFDSGKINITYQTTSFNLSAPITLPQDKQWEIEWKGTRSGTDAILLGEMPCYDTTSTKYSSFIYITDTWQTLGGAGFKLYDNDPTLGSDPADIKFDLADGKMTKFNEDHTWKLVHDPVGVTTKLYMDGEVFAETDAVIAHDFIVGGLFGKFEDATETLSYGGILDYLQITIVGAGPVIEPPAVLPVLEIPHNGDTGANQGKAFEPAIDISSYMANGYVHIWLNVGEGAIAPGNIELCSGGNSDKNEIKVVPEAYITTTGDQHIAVKLSDFVLNLADEPFDPTALNYFRIYTSSGAGAPITISRVAISNSAEAPAAPAPVETDPPATDAPATNPPAPVTSDASIAIGSVVLAAAAAAIVVISKKRK